MARSPTEALGSILVIDDDRDILDALSETLTEAGWQVITADGAIEGVALARSHSVDVVLTDVLMPDTDGLSLAGTLRRDPALASIPIVFMTASIGHARNLGREIVVEKPFALPNLLATLRSCLPGSG
jgi:CheY-like chemotaxis protein